MQSNKGCSIILENSEGNILLQLRDDVEKWQLPGGHMEENESPRGCIKREMMEEMELKLPFIEYFSSFNWIDRIDIIFRSSWDIDVENTPLHEGKEIKYFSLKEVQELDLYSNDNIIVEEYARFINRK